MMAINEIAVFVFQIAAGILWASRRQVETRWLVSVDLPAHLQNPSSQLGVAHGAVEFGLRSSNDGCG